MSSNKSKTPDINAQRKRAVQLRLAGNTLASVRAEVGLSTPTIVAAVKAFKTGGWPAVDVKPRGRPPLHEAHDSRNVEAHKALLAHFTLDATNTLWSTSRVRHWLKKSQQLNVSIQTAANYLQTWQLQPESPYRIIKSSKSTAAAHWLNGEYNDFKVRAHNTGSTLLWIAIRSVDANLIQLHAHTLRGRSFWMMFSKAPTSDAYNDFFEQLLTEFPNGIALVSANKNLGSEVQRFASHSEATVLSQIAPANSTTNTKAVSTIASKKKTPLISSSHSDTVTQDKTGHAMTQVLSSLNSAENPLSSLSAGLTHLQRLEAESIQILREVVAEAENPVMMYSMGKDSAVMLHLARKAFYPANPPFPLLHVDTAWKFQDMYRFRDSIAKDQVFELLTHVNPEGVEKGVNPFTHGSALHTDIMKTQGLKQALDKHGFDVAIGGARRDEEKSRAKERVFSFRTAQHRWEPKSQRPELWNLYNTRKHPGETIRAFPISNWTELDIWQYIHLQDIPVVPLYYAAERPVVERDGNLIMVDDDRMPLNDGEVPMMRKVRFRTLGCYPLTGAVESNATTLPEIIQEMLLTKKSERQGRMIDHNTSASMEKKKLEGYF